MGSCLFLGNTPSKHYANGLRYTTKKHNVKRNTSYGYFRFTKRIITYENTRIVISGISSKPILVKDAFAD